MKKIFNKFTKILLLACLIISDLMTPIKVFADEIDTVKPQKGDVGINETVSENADEVSVTKGSLTNPGDVLVTKTVKKNGEGKFTVEFEVKGKDVENTTTVTKPVYAVVVFDRSGSMEEYNYNNCLSYGWFGFCNEYEEVKFSAAVSGAKTFASTLLEKIPNAQIGLVTFAKTASVAKDFNSNLENDLSDANFGNPDGGTNLHAGLIEANRLLSDSSIPENAKKYVVIISDGEPTLYIDDNGNSAGPGSSTDKDVYDNTKSMDDTIKEYAEVFSIGYSLPNGEVYNNMTAAQILENMATEDNTSEEDYVRHYYDSNPEEVAAAFSDIATSISKVNAGTGATINDNIGASFSVDASSSSLITIIGDSVSNTSTFDITEEGTKISFDVEINGDEADGWVNVNEGFTLTYTDYNGEEKTITYGSDEPQPQVYWERNTYNYVINYYKDEVTNTSDSEHYLGTSGNLSAFNGETITLTDEQKNAHIITGYELSSSNVYTITIDKTKDNIINVLYTLKKFNYDVNYYYDGIKDNDKSYTESDVTYGTVVNANELYFANTDEYSLDTERSTSGNVTINDNGITIDIYYKKNSYSYSVHYNFNNEEDTSFAKNPAALYGTELFAGDFYLTSSELAANYSDYFLEPGNSKNTETITVGNKENRLDIYYVNTNFSNNESITKSATTNGNKVTSSNQVVNYKINYSDVINNVREGDTVTVTLVDTLPFKGTVTGLTEGCSYDNDKTITCTITKTADKFESHYEVSEEVEYSAVYEDFADISSSSNPKLVNTVNGKTTVTSGNIVKESAGVEATAEVPVEISGNLIVHHYTKDEEGNNVSVYSDERSSALVGSDYETNYRTDIVGYTVDTENIPTNKDGKYAEADTVVTYYYVKKDGEISNPEAEKTGPRTVESINSEFDYTVKGTATIKDYVGTYKVKVTDTLPYKIDTENSTLDDRCTYDGNKTITCVSEEKTITADSYDANGEYDIEESFDLKLVFIGVDNETVINTAKVEIILDNNNDESDTTTTETKVAKGTAKAVYLEKDNEDNILAPEEVATGTGLVGSDYTTEAKEIFGYDLDSTPENQNGTYIDGEIIVKYLYTKKDGFIDAPAVVKEGPAYVTSIDSIFNYTLKVDTKIKDYVGDATLTVTDILPYKIDLSKSTLDNRCTYDGDKTIVCTVNYNDIDESNYEMIDGEKVYVVSESFNLKLVFIDITNEKVTNKVNAIIELDNNSEDGEHEVTTTVEKGSAKAVYLEKNNEDNVLAPEEEASGTGLVGSEYTTESKEIFGYTLDKQPENQNGTYTKDEIIVKYLYNKNKGVIEDSTTDKTGPESVLSINDVFEYTVTGTATIKDYVGNYKVKVTDTLPFEIDANKSTLDNRCTYNGNKTITCVSEEKTVTESDYVTNEDGEKVFNISESFTLSIVYKDINTESVKNKATIEVILDDNSSTSEEDTVDTKVLKGTVVATYKTVDDEELAGEVTTDGIGGSEYTTEAKEFFGYHLTKEPENQNGTYIANSTIYVEYIYELNDGKITDNEVTKEGPEIISDMNEPTEYVFTYTGAVEDYIGKATLTITDKLPYEIYYASYGEGCDYDFDNNTFTCKVEYDITEEDYVDGVYNIHEEFYLDVLYGEIDSDVITNTVESKLELRKVYADADDSVDSKVLKGSLLVSYVDEEGNVLDSYTVTDYAGIYYETEEREFDGYTIKSTPENAEGFLVADETIYVEYVYSKNVGTYEELPPQTGYEGASVNYIKYVLAALFLLLIGKKKEAKNN